MCSTCLPLVSFYSLRVIGEKEVMTGCSYVVFEMVANPYKSWNFGGKAYNSWLKVP